MANKPKKSAQQIPVVFQRMHEQAAAILAVLHNKIGLEYALHSEEYGIDIRTKGIGVDKSSKTGKRTRKQIVPFGAYANTYKPLLTGLEKDGYARIPINGMNPSGMQSAISAWCSQNWGNGSYTCLRSKDGLFLEVWRFPDGVDSSLLKGAMPALPTPTAEPPFNIEDFRIK